MFQSLGFLETFGLKVRRYSNGWGKVWWLLNMLFRGLVVIALGSSLYSDEFSMFKCDTKQPGCIQVCFNKFTPMNPIRFWTFQMVFLFIPTIFFYAYANNFNNRVEKVEQLRKDIEQLITPENSIKEYNFSEAKELRKREAEIFLKQKQLDKSVRELGVYKSKVKIDVLEGPPDKSDSKKEKHAKKLANLVKQITGNSDKSSASELSEEDENEPKKFSIFDDPIIDMDNPVYFSMYDKVKVRGKHPKV